MKKMAISMTLLLSCSLFADHNDHSERRENRREGCHRKLTRARRENQRLRTELQIERERNQDLLEAIREGRGLPSDDPSIESAYFCYASCKTSSGEAGNSKFGSAEAKNPLEAKQLAIAKTMENYDCYYGATSVSCEEQDSQRSEQTYCMAACRQSDGQASSSKTSGQYGNSTSEASYKALKATMDAYDCYYGASIVECH